MISLCQLCLFAWASLTPVKEFVETQAKVCTYQVPSEWGGHSFSYRLLQTGKAQAQEFPLLVWLHGYGDYEYDLENVGQLKYIDELFPDSATAEQTPLYLLAVQLPRELGKWTYDFGPKPGDDGLAVVEQIVSQVIADHPIDEDRIYAVGISGGGSAAWSLAIRYPDRYAAIAPLASKGLLSGSIEPGQPFPQAIWAFHGSGDDPRHVQSTVDRFGRAGANVHLTLIPGAAHNCWTRAMKDYQLLGWLLAQRRDRRAWWQRPGRTPWPRADLLAQLTLPLAMSLAIALEIRRQHRRRSRPATG